MTHLLPAGRASRQHGSPGASWEGGGADADGLGGHWLHPWEPQPHVYPWLGGQSGQSQSLSPGSKCPDTQGGSAGLAAGAGAAWAVLGRVLAAQPRRASSAPSPPAAPTPLAPASWLMAPGPQRQMPLKHFLLSEKSDSVPHAKP